MKLLYNSIGYIQKTKELKIVVIVHDPKIKRACLGQILSRYEKIMLWLFEAFWLAAQIFTVNQNFWNSVAKIYV